MTGDVFDNLADDFYAPIEVAAVIMGISSEQVKRLIRIGVLKVRSERGTLLVRPDRVPA